VIVSALELQRSQNALEGLRVPTVIVGSGPAGAGQFRSHMITRIRVEPLFQGVRCEAQSLPSRCHLDRFEIQIRQRRVS